MCDATLLLGIHTNEVCAKKSEVKNSFVDDLTQNNNNNKYKHTIIERNDSSHWHTGKSPTCVMTFPNNRRFNDDDDDDE